jgi:hypothetical protein
MKIRCVVTILALLAAGCSDHYDGTATQAAITHYSEALAQTSETDGSRAQYLRTVEVSKCPQDMQDAWNAYLKALDDYSSAIAEKKSGLAPVVISRDIQLADVKLDDTRKKLSDVLHNYLQ